MVPQRVPKKVPAKVPYKVPQSKNSDTKWYHKGTDKVPIRYGSSDFGNASLGTQKKEGTKKGTEKGTGGNLRWKFGFPKDFPSLRSRSLEQAKKMLGRQIAKLKRFNG